MATPRMHYLGQVVNEERRSSYSGGIPTAQDEEHKCVPMSYHKFILKYATFVQPH